ncbi:deoxynucleoside triphosphate triphosphohydrolase SAMHD1-like, partial [Lingula anatina]
MAALKRKSEPFADSEEAWEKKPKAMSMSFKKWGVEEVCDFLTQNELDAVIPLFKAEAISGSVLPDLTEEQLAKIGVACLGTRLTILQIIKHLQGKREEEEAQSNGFGTSLHLHLK